MTHTTRHANAGLIPEDNRDIRPSHCQQSATSTKLVPADEHLGQCIVRELKEVAVAGGGFGYG